MIHRLISTYNEDVKVYDQIAGRYFSIISNILVMHDIQGEISQRIKTKASISKKMIEKSYLYSDIKDVLGMRVVVETLKDLEEFDKEFSTFCAEFIVARDAKSENIKVNQFGYLSIHYDIKFTHCDVDYIFELQARTIIQDAWSRFSHSVEYKSKGLSTPEIKRAINSLSALLEIADYRFLEIKKMMSALELNKFQQLRQIISNYFIRNTDISDYNYVLTDKFGSVKKFV